jgi:spore coat protein H
MLDAVNDEKQDINRVIDRFFNRKNYLTWLAVNILTGNLDTVSQNFLLYSPSDASGWYFMPWDYDGAWGFYEQPDQIGNGFLPRWRQGIQNWSVVSLHRRFLSNSNNVAELNACVDKLKLNCLTADKIQNRLDTYRETVTSFMLQNPDAGDIASFNREYDRLAGVVGENYTNYYQTLNRPFPVKLHVPIASSEGIRFEWDASSAIFKSEIVYDFQLASSPGFEPDKMLASRSDLTLPGVWIDTSNIKGTNFWRVIIREANDSTNWQIASDSYYEPDTGRPYHGVSILIVP